MLGAERLLADRQRALVERPRHRKLALGLKQAGEVAEARRRIGMLGAERLLADRQRALEERPRRRKVALGLIPLPDHFECATALSPLPKHRSPGSDSIQTDLGSV